MSTIEEQEKAKAAKDAEIQRFINDKDSPYGFFGMNPQDPDEGPFLPLTQLSGGGPTVASICIHGNSYINGRLYVDPDGYIIFREHPSKSPP